ncbi:MAG TPA: PucR family transcriptional regulator [Acidimicrobiales bacterium]|jgi:purine catabolism regulator
MADAIYAEWPTVADVLALPEVRAGRPTVEAGSEGLHRHVRWAHVSELADIGQLLQGGELVLTTGVALPETDAGLARYVADLARAQATGVIFELGRRFQTLPSALVRSANDYGLPLIALHSEVAFVAITEAVHSIIVNDQIRQLQLGEAAHRAFRSLSVQASTPQDIVHHVAALSGCPTVFENLARHVLVFDGAHGATARLENWEYRSREASASGACVLSDGEHWLTTPVAARGQAWGRLILMSAAPATALQQTILELGATNLALHLLIERDEHLLEYQTHRTLIGDILNHNYLSPEEIHTRAMSLGVVMRRQFVAAMVLQFECEAPLSDIARHARARDEIAATSAALTDVGCAGLVGLLEPGRLGVVVTAPTEVRVRNLLDPVSRAVHARAAKLAPPGSVVIGVGSIVNAIDHLGQCFAEATEAADAAKSLPKHRLYVTTSDIRLRGLIYLLRDDPRLQSYAERELGPLLSYDERHHTDLLATLSAYLDAGGNKSATAAATFMNRATLYHRLSRIEEVLNCDLESPESRYSLYVALMVRNSFDARANRR